MNMEEQEGEAEKDSGVAVREKNGKEDYLCASETKTTDITVQENTEWRTARWKGQKEGRCLYQQCLVQSLWVAPHGRTQRKGAESAAESIEV